MLPDHQHSADVLTDIAGQILGNLRFQADPNRVSDRQWNIERL
jgi:hypothetical protein